MSKGVIITTIIAVLFITVTLYVMGRCYLYFCDGDKVGIAIELLLVYAPMLVQCYLMKQALVSNSSSASSVASIWPIIALTALILEHKLVTPKDGE